jgi:hypothetical protein
MNVSIKIDKRLINDADIDTNAFALGCLQAIHEESGMYLDKKSLKLGSLECRLDGLKITVL